MQPPPRISPPAEICLIRLSAIGDCCHTVPVVRAMQDAWPQTRITWIIGRTEHGLVEGMEGVDFVVFDKRAGLSGYLDVRRKLRGQRFPYLLHMHASMRANLISLVVRADVRIGFDRARARDYQWLFTNDRIPPRSEQHVMDGLFEFIERIGIEKGAIRWDIPIPEAAREFAAGICAPPGPVCIISPCSSQRFRNYRNWSIGNYSALARYLHEHYGARIVLTGGPTAAEREFGRSIAETAAAPISDLIGKTSLKQLVAVLEAADLLVCPDSGPAHMATAVGTPVVGLYATSNRHRTGPYFSQHLVADRYPDAVAREFHKPVSQLRWGQRVRDPDAMDLITLDDVRQKVDIALEGNKSQLR